MFYYHYYIIIQILFVLKPYRHNRHGSNNIFYGLLTNKFIEKTLSI